MKTITINYLCHAVELQYEMDKNPPIVSVNQQEIIKLINAIGCGNGLPIEEFTRHIKNIVEMAKEAICG